MTPVLALRVHASVVDGGTTAPGSLAATDAVGAGIGMHRLRVAAIGCAYRDDEALRVRALGLPGQGECALLGELGRILERLSPCIVTWDGTAHDLALLRARAFALGVPLPGLFSPMLKPAGHVDLVDALGLRGAQALPLSEMATACGMQLPFGDSLSSAAATGAALPFGVDATRASTELEAATVLLMWSRLQLVRGRLTPAEHASETARLRAFAHAIPAAHWKAFAARLPVA